MTTQQGKAVTKESTGQWESRGGFCNPDGGRERLPGVDDAWKDCQQITVSLATAKAGVRKRDLG